MRARAATDEHACVHANVSARADPTTRSRSTFTSACVMRRQPGVGRRGELATELIHDAPDATRRRASHDRRTNVASFCNGYDLLPSIRGREVARAQSGIHNVKWRVKS